MCGIAGLMTIDGTSPSDEVLDAFANCLAHRGPDGHGRFREKNVALVQTRLAIIDLETGDQPIHGPDGNVISANGEVYNFVELRAALPDVPMKTASDCEPPLHLYARKGLAFVDDLRGMFAISIYDADRGRLILSRDPFGIKPLYYAETQRGFAFASEPQALIGAGLVKPQVRDTARDAFLQLQFSTGRNTIFKGIKRVLPGETLIVERGLVVEHHMKYALKDKQTKPMRSMDAMKAMEEALIDSVKVHQRADVPYGLFLSGGIDSSALLSLMAELNDNPIKAYTAGFSGTDVQDEREHARMLAQKVGADHTEVEFDENDFLTLLPKIAEAIDDPVADYAVLPTFKLAREARKDVKVVLSGEGADELLGGYGRYRAYCRPWPLRKPMRGTGTFDGLGVFKDNMCKGWHKGIENAENFAKQFNWTRLQRAQAIDCIDWLPHDLLIKLDRCLMANGVEGRTPFLDPVVADATFYLPDNLKISNKLGKSLLRDWLSRRLPEAKPFSKKRGFTVPVGHWIASHGAKLGPLVAYQPAVEEICDRNAVIRLFTTEGKEEGFAAWTLLFYALWHQRHILQLKCDGDVFEALAQK
ncbi:asparagine synthase (glutamine-hydrolyzing) [Terasakiella sp. A23]|uniref:asparagine synthase (glutamine-hydrolyzing) n=1 Tax=Terasakiella sp. FCG-A23 TaxID=3080561 RepID=UPI0029531144|nr:asparagine synthase (glutamine-hydrolyzing) [Terasakiella sp. A23]MDV7339206.1 asparagine synthase (glutamine-hydrolyzing) [Terasakiella sp. A23]